MIILCPHAAVVESAYTADLKSAPKGYGFKSRQRHHVGSGALHAAAEQKARPFARRLCIRFPDPPFKIEALLEASILFLRENLPPSGEGGPRLRGG